MTHQKSSPSRSHISFEPGDRVIATDTTGMKYEGYLHHENGCGQFYVMADNRLQPFYAYPCDLTALGQSQPGFIPKDCHNGSMGITSTERQAVYVEYRQGHRSV